MRALRRRQSGCIHDMPSAVFLNSACKASSSASSSSADGIERPGFRSSGNASSSASSAGPFPYPGASHAAVENGQALVHRSQPYKVFPQARLTLSGTVPGSVAQNWMQALVSRPGTVPFPMRIAPVGQASTHARHSPHPDPTIFPLPDTSSSVCTVSTWNFPGVSKTPIRQAGPYAFVTTRLERPMNPNPAITASRFSGNREFTATWKALTESPDSAARIRPAARSNRTIVA